ncbi:MAG: hypothetical protein ACOXZH_01340 [Bacteroidales bacterium]|jgi:hypothetical protein|nr:hypothetical protein [Bacteroidales bacterium]HPX59740.1 hypothetical protein [Bacteroidales bacterium]
MAYRNIVGDNNHQKKNKIIAIVSVVVVYILMFFCFMFLGLTHQVPPPPEYGIEVDMSGGGGGGSSGSENQSTTSTSTAQSANRFATQRTEETSSIATGKNQQTTQATTPTINEDALFKRRTTQGTGGQGTGQGTGEGSGIGPGSGSGSGGGSGAGYGTGDGDFWLDGRPVIKKAFPKSKNNLEGLVIVEFRADKEGNVIYVKAGVKGTTILDVDIWKECEKAAKESKFKSKSDAATEEKGIIRYRFVIQ